MISTSVDSARNLVLITPVDALQKQDFDVLADTINQYINKNDVVPALVIETKKFPHWANFSSLVQHIKLIKNFQQIVPKVAIVSDSEALKILPSLAEHFLKAKIRHFAIEDVEQAKAWAAAKDDDLGTDAKILVALDDSEYAEKTLQKAIDVACKDQAELIVLHVASPHELSDKEWDSAQGGSIETYMTTRNMFNTVHDKEILAHAVDEATKHSVRKVVTFLKQDGAAKAILDVAKRENVALIILGRHKHNRMTEMFHNNVVQYVLKHADRSVLVVV